MPTSRRQTCQNSLTNIFNWSWWKCFSEQLWICLKKFFKSVGKKIKCLNREIEKNKEEPNRNFKTEKYNNWNLKSKNLQWIGSTAEYRGQKKESVNLKINQCRLHIMKERNKEQSKIKGVLEKGGTSLSSQTCA